jgi:hypothetical protein
MGAELKEIHLTDPLFLDIMSTHVIREDMKEKFGAWLRSKLAAEYGEELLTYIKPSSPSTNKQEIPVVDTVESLGFIHINK